MPSGRQRRAERRAAERRALREAKPPPQPERRLEDRRTEPPLEGEDLDRRLRELGISENRRRAPGDRRTGGDRRIR